MCEIAPQVCMPMSSCGPRQYLPRRCPPAYLPACPQSEGTRHFFQQVEQCQPLWASLQQACRCVSEATSPAHHICPVAVTLT
jgi:hypothetical protein